MFVLPVYIIQCVCTRVYDIIVITYYYVPYITVCTNEKLAAVRVFLSLIVVNLLHACYTACNIIIFVVVVVVVFINTYLTATLAAVVVSLGIGRSATIPVEHTVRIS